MTTAKNKTKRWDELSAEDRRKARSDGRVPERRQHDGRDDRHAQYLVQEPHAVRESEEQDEPQQVRDVDGLPAP